MQALVGALQHEADLALQPAQEFGPGDGLQLRLRQLGKARVASDETFQVAGAVLDGGEHLAQPLVPAAAHQFGTRMGQRGDRRQRVVELVADHPDHLLPGLYFLAPQFRGEQADQQQFVAAAVEAEVAPRKVEHILLVALVGYGEQAVAAAPHRLAQFRRQAVQQRVQVLALELAPVVEQLACGQVGVDHPALSVATFGRQQHRHRGVLHHGVQQQFALDQVLALLPQHLAQLGVGAHQLADLVVAGPVHAEVELAVAIGVDAAGQGPEQRAQG